MRYKKTTPGSAYGKAKSPKKKASKRTVASKGQKKKKVPTHAGSRRRSRS